MTRHVLFVVLGSRQGRSERVPPGDGRIGVLKGDRGQPSCPRKNKGQPPTPSASCRRTFSRRPAITFRPKMWSVRKNLPGLGRSTRSSRHPSWVPPKRGLPLLWIPPYLKVARFACSKVDCNRMDAPEATKRPGAKFPGSRLERIFSPPALVPQGGPYPGPGYPIASFCTHLIVQSHRRPVKSPPDPYGNFATPIPAGYPKPSCSGRRRGYGRPSSRPQIFLPRDREPLAPGYRGKGPGRILTGKGFARPGASSRLQEIWAAADRTGAGRSCPPGRPA